MKRLTLLLLAVLFPIGGYVVGYSSAQQKVESKGLKPAVKLEATDFGHLSELNGKYKFRAGELTIEPGGYVGEHQHVGPGIRYVVSGEVTAVAEGKTTIYKAGDFFYETGAITGSASNKGSSPVVILQFEILPADWKGGSGVPPKSR